MPTDVIDMMVARTGMPVVDEHGLDRLLASRADAPEHALLFFTGDPEQRMETADVAVVLPELIRHFAGKLHGVVIAREAEASLKERFGVMVMPSLVMMRRDQPLGVLPKVRDWAEYIEKITAWLPFDDSAESPRPRVRPRIVPREVAQ